MRCHATKEGAKKTCSRGAQQFEGGVERRGWTRPANAEPSDRATLPRRLLATGEFKSKRFGIHRT